MRNRKTILLLILLLVVGFAAVSTTLVLNGTIGIATKKSDFNVIFTSATLDGIENKELIDDSTKRTITYETKRLTAIDETTTLSYEATNTSRLYDAEVTVSCTPINNEYIKIEYSPTTMTLMSGETKTGSITTKLINVSTEEQNINITCTLNANAMERESLGNEYIPYNVTFNTNGGETINISKEVSNGGTYGELPTPTKENFEFLGWYTDDREKVDSTTLVKNENHTLIAGWRNPNLNGYEISYDADLDGIEDIGDEIKVGTESFYVISHTTTELNGLAKYNINVGSNKNPNVKEGVQHETVRGYFSGITTYGNVVFSNQKGWPNANDDIIDIRNQAYGEGPVKDALYGTNGYESYIKQTINNAQVRLITKEELEGLGCSSSNNLCTLAPSWVTSTSYWTQSSRAYYDSNVWRVDSIGNFGDYPYEVVNYYGVRPVITIPKA